MPKQILIGLLAAIGGLAGGLLGSLIEEQGKKPNSILNKYGLIGAIATIIVSLVVNAWLNTEGRLHANWRWHRWRYLRRLKSNLLQKEGQMKFGPLDFQQRVSSLLPQIVVDDVRQNMVETLLDLIRDNEHPACKVLILGEPGSGKTTGIEHLTYQLAVDAVRHVGFGGRIPVLAQLGKYLEGSLLDFAAASLKDLGGENGEVLGKGLKKLIEKDQVILLLDSLDEALGDRRDVVRAQLKELVESESYRSLPVVITGRTREDPSSGLDRLQVFEIQDLSNKAVEAFIKNYKPPEADERKIWDQLKSYNLLEPKGLGKNPFWLRLIVKNNIFNRDKSALLNEAVDRLFQREWDEKRENKQQWKRVLARDVQLEGTKSALGWLAYKMSVDSVLTMDSDKASQILSTWLGSKDWFKGLTSQDVVMLGQDAQLLRYRAQSRIGRQPLQFRHRLLQEFLTAWSMHEAEKPAPDVLERFSASDQYWETLILLGGIIEDRAALIEAALGDGLDSRRILLAIALLHSHTKIDESLRTKLLSAFVKALEGGITEELQKAAQQLSLLIGESVVDAIGQLLNSAIPVNVKLGLIEILTALGGDKAVSYLIQSVDDAEVAEAVNKAFIAIGKPAIEPLLASLRERSVELRAPVMNALTAIGSPSVPALIEEMGTPDLNLRQAVVQVLGRIADSRAITPLLAELVSDVPTPIEQRSPPLNFERAIQHKSQQQKALYFATIDALTQIGEPAVPHLIQYLSFNDPILGNGVRLILSGIGQPAVNALTRNLAIDESQAYRILESGTDEGDGTVGPHVRGIKLNFGVSSERPVDFYNVTTFPKKFWDGFYLSRSVPLTNLMDESEIKSFGPSIQQLFSQNLADLSDTDAGKRLQAVEFFIKIRSIYRTETNLIHHAYSRTTLRTFFAPLLNTASQALTVATGDSNPLVSRTAFDELLTVDYTLDFLADVLKPSQDKKDIEILRAEMSNAIAYSTTEQELQNIERTKEKIIKTIEQLRDSE